MALSNVLSTMDTVLTGNPKKAKLTIVSSTEQGALGSLAMISSPVATQGAQNALQSGLGIVSDAVGGLGTMSMDVHYNPSSIHLQANAESINVSYLLKNVDDGIPRQQTRPPSITMRVDLVFDDMNVKDAFMAEKFKMLSLSESATGLISSGAALVRSITGQHYSVQAQTNGLISLLNKKSTRQVTFSWADFSFTGEVNQVQARYTMFSTSGRPIRSIVTLVITQEFNEQESNDKWNTAFDKGFAANLSDAGNRSIGQKVGNLLNISGF